MNDMRKLMEVVVEGEVDSTWIGRIEHNGKHGFVVVNNGERASYVIKNMPEELYNRWESASSQGEFFHNEIKLHYVIDRISPEQVPIEKEEEVTEDLRNSGLQIAFQKIVNPGITFTVTLDPRSYEILNIENKYKIRFPWKVGQRIPGKYSYENWAVVNGYYVKG